MKEEILNICDRLRAREITEEGAKNFLLFLFGVRKHYTLETYTPRRDGYRWYILDNKTNEIIDNFENADVGVAENKLIELNELSEAITKSEVIINTIDNSKLLVHGLDGRVYNPETIGEWDSSVNCQKGDILYKATEIKRY